MSNRKIPDSVAKLTEEFVREISELYQERLDKVILFGSYARGEQTEDSDIDYLVVLNDHEIRPYTEISNMSEITFGLSLKYAVSVSAIPTTSSKLEAKLTPLMSNVYLDGIEI
ncbi:nucleotidyltransferase domain-containing protein [Dyadobacter luteus]|jgi:predicted nucleotidyltransferase|uniref:Nucleotidyltransferase domain-containing protein n=1 Tax=Dyadobacter luteus TaxID=2259619 RepID=A0A3D8Y6N9_9BACT|nr:nucleotidyltransferase domain-containing protein [Dyadobacter luteus]REA58475.1 nucleotidyltransferase domain-containing protein [Dyadobacter luteus]